MQQNFFKFATATPSGIWHAIIRNTQNLVNSKNITRQLIGKHETFQKQMISIVNNKWLNNHLHVNKLS